MTTIPEPIATAAAALLAPYRPGITPAKLEAALSGDHERELTDELMTRKEAAAALRISLPTLLRMQKTNEISFVRVRRRLLIKAESVRAIIAGKAPRKAAEQTETQPIPEAETAQSSRARKQW